jgi:hypothetical protein
MKLRWYGLWCQSINHLSLHVSLYLASPFLQRVARTALPRLHRSYDPLRLPYVRLRFVRFSLSLPDTLLCLSFNLCFFSDSTLEAETSSKCLEFCLLTGFPVTFILSARTTHGSLKFPNYPFEYMPCSKTPVEIQPLAISQLNLLPSTPLNGVGFHSYFKSLSNVHNSNPFRGSITRPVSSLSSGFELPLPGLPSDFVTDLLAKL